MTADGTKGRRRLAWPIVGLILVVLAFALAVVGTALALQQAEAVNTRLTVHAKLRAGQIARTAADLFHLQINWALRSASDQWLARGAFAWREPPDFPTWVDAIYAWDGSRLTPIGPAKEPPEGLIDLIRLRAAPPPLDDPTELGTTRAEFAYLPGSPDQLIAFTRTQSATGWSTVLAAVIDTPELHEGLLLPLVAMDDGLELVASEAITGPWSQSIAGAMRAWAIQPSTTYAREQRYAVIGQTTAYIGLTLVSLGTMLAAMWLIAKAARREIALAEMKANFVADVSHELKTPLALIRLFGETLLSGRVTAEAKQREYYEIITRESTRLTNLINSILDFSRIEAGRKEYSLSPTDIGRVVADTYNAYKAELDHLGFAHRLTIEPNLPLVAADADAVSQSVLNLINNAVKYSEDVRYVSVEVTADTRRDARCVIIAVEDRGIGISPEDRAHIFEGFYRSADGRVRQRAGTGLGLSVVKHIVEGHHGVLEVEPRLVTGSRFRIVLPAIVPEEPANPEKTAPRGGN